MPIYSDPYFEGFNPPALEINPRCQGCPILDEYLIMLSNRYFEMQLEGSSAERLMSDEKISDTDLMNRGKLVENAARKVAACLQVAEILQANCAGPVSATGTNGEIAVEFTACGSPEREEWALNPDLTRILPLNQ